MLPRTSTTIGELRAGDRFYFPSDAQRIVYEITAMAKSEAAYNIVVNGNSSWRYDKSIPNLTKPVVFVRHTQL
jgi:hypothetical protein